MNRVKFELNIKGLNELMKSSEMQSHLNTITSSILARAGKGYEAKVDVASYDSLGKVYPTDAESARDNLENNTLEKALGGLPRTKE